MSDITLAKVSSAFCDPPGMEAILELQKRMEKICNPPWLKQMEQINSVFQQQMNGSMSAFQAIQPAALSSIQSVADILHPAWMETIKSSHNYSAMMDLVRRDQEVYSYAAPILELHSALSAYMSDWPAINKVIQDSSLASQKEYAVARACALADSISGLIDEEEEPIDDYPTELSDEDKQIIAEEVSSILSSEKNWEQRLMDSIIRLKSTHPVLAAILDKIIFTILLGVVASLIATVIGQARFPAKVYDEPKTTSQVIYHLEPLEQVKIIGEQPYYYQIELTDNSTQETLIGFVSKRSIQQVDMQDESSAGDAVD